jgi:hypothetical protein
MINWQNCLRCLGIWRRIFLRSAVNDATYHGDQLPRHYWEWPGDTYVHRRLDYLKQHSHPESAADRPRELRSIDEQTDSDRANLQPRPSTILPYNSVDKNYRK